ncbi:MAG: universal stress protein [Nitrosopumilaceae archaeon]|jgi:nucleotide-binding universal stress UspA family protein
MEKIKTILVPMDGSKNSFKALTKAIFLAKKCGASISALYVLRTAFDNPNLIYVPQTQNELKKVEKFLDTAKNQVIKNSIKFKKEIVFGHEAKQIIDFAQKKKFDLIVIGARGRGTIKQMLLGSVSNAVVHSSKVPVLVIR